LPAEDIADTGAGLGPLLAALLVAALGLAGLLTALGLAGGVLWLI
jgi:hypothetical protein